MEITTFFCPRCQTLATRNRYSGDYVHNCQGNQSLREEDVLILGDWEDYTGSDTVHPNILTTSPPNKVQSKRTGIEGVKVPAGRTKRGFPTNRYRTRQHREYINEDFFKSKSEKPDRDPKSWSGE